MTGLTDWAPLVALVAWGLFHSLVLGPWLFWNRTLSVPALVRLIDRLAEAADAAQNDQRVKRALGRLGARLGFGGDGPGGNLTPEKALKWALLQRLIGPLMAQAEAKVPGYLPEAPAASQAPRTAFLTRLRR